MLRRSYENAQQNDICAYLSKYAPRAIIVIVAAVILFLLFVTPGCSSVQVDEDRSTTEVDERVNENNLNPSPTPEEIDLVRLILQERCNGTNCFVYISYPENAKPELYDADNDRGPFLRMISRSGDNATRVREGNIFVAIQKLHCRPEDQCGIEPLIASDGVLEVIIYNAPRGEHDSYMFPEIAFVMP